MNGVSVLTQNYIFHHSKSKFSAIWMRKAKIQTFSNTTHLIFSRPISNTQTQQSTRWTKNHGYMHTFLLFFLASCIMYKSLIDVERKRISSGSGDSILGVPEVNRGQLIARRKIAAASAVAFPSSGDSCEFGSSKYFALCGVGGILSCGITHTMITPLDLVKCRLQVDSAKYKNLINGFRVTLKEEGTRGLGRGWAPTCIGYSAQGLCKFGFYEVFKCWYSDLLGEENAYVYRTWLYLASSASAEFIADIALSPWESAKVKIQTTAGYANTLRQCVPKMMKEEGMNAFYKSLVPLWMRQIPYTMMKFACFEKTIEVLYKYVVPKPRDQCSKGEQLVVTFAAGYIAGVFCAIVSHPADTVVSKLNQNKEATVGQIVKDLGFFGVWKGLIPRIIMIGTLTAAQWFIYDAVKVYLRLPRPPPPEMPESLKKKLEAAGKL